jgi:hypothetical protein
MSGPRVQRPGPAARLFAAGLCIALPLQFALAAWINARDAEPWPVVTLPSFGTTYPGSEVALDVPAFVVELADGGSVELTPGQVFASIPRSLQGGLMRARFRQTATHAAVGDNPSTWRWLDGRVAALLGEHPVSIAVRWRREHYNRRGERLALAPEDEQWVRLEHRS